MIILALFCIAVPVFMKIMIVNNQKRSAINNANIIVNNQSVSENNLFYHHVKRYSQRKEKLEECAANKNDDLAIQLLDKLVNEYLFLAKHIKTNRFKHRIFWSMDETIITLFIHNYIDEYTKQELASALDKAGLDISLYKVADDEIEKQKILDMQNKKLDVIYKLARDNDFIAYYNFNKHELEQEQTTLLENIKTLEKDIVENIEKEEMYNEQIESCKHQLSRNSISIDILEYRIENRVVPDYTDWRHDVLSSKENALMELENEILTREEFEENGFSKQWHKTYHQYKLLMEGQRNKYTNIIVKADKSLAANKPDMEFVYNGVRRMSVRFLLYSLLVSMFGILIGGGIIAKEFSNGTIKLLLIRPKTRTKLVLSKLFALIIVCFIICTIGVVLNMLTNGILYGFKDFAYPNFTLLSGENGVSFFIIYIGKFFTCFLSIMVACVMAISLSTITKNTAVSVAVPFVIKFASLVLVLYAQDPERMNWVFHTFIPYLNICIYESEYWSYGFEPIMYIGVPEIIGLITIIFIIALVVFNRRDIAD